jgi:hypothetical protein
LSDEALRPPPTRAAGLLRYGCGMSSSVKTSAKEPRMQRNSLWLSTVALAAALAAFQAGAEPGAALPAAGRFGSVTVISGGVDLDQAAAFKQAAPQYPLRVVFSVRGGNYAVADEFTLLHKGSVVAQVPDAGPWLLIDAPAGTYTMQARIEGRTVERAVTVGRSGNTVHWVVAAS